MNWIGKKINMNIFKFLLFILLFTFNSCAKHDLHIDIIYINGKTESLLIKNYNNVNPPSLSDGGCLDIPYSGKGSKPVIYTTGYYSCGVQKFTYYYTKSKK